MKKITITALITLCAAGCFFYSFSPVGTDAYSPDSNLRMDSIYQKDGTDSVFRYLRSSSQNKFLYRIRTALYNQSGLVSTRQKTLAVIVTPTTGNAQTIDISSAGFTQVMSVQAQVETSTATANDVPIVALKSYTNTQVVLNIVQGNSSAVSVLGVNVLGLRFLQAPTASKIHVLVVGY